MLGHLLQHIHVIHLTGSSCARKQIKIKTNKTYRFKQVWNSWYSAEAKSYMTGGGICSLHSCAVITGKGKTWKSVHKITSSILLLSISVELREFCRVSQYQSCFQISYQWSLVLLYLAWSFIPGPSYSRCPSRGISPLTLWRHVWDFTGSLVILSLPPLKKQE